MNWLQRIAQKPMALPVAFPGRLPGAGATRIDDLMTEQTAREQYSPTMEPGGEGSFGVVYKIGPNEMAKYTKDPREAETVQFVFDNKFDWVVPVLAPPEQVQYDPPIYKIVMKELKPLSMQESNLVDFLEYHYHHYGIPDIEDVMEEYVPYLDVDTVMYIYNRTRYIFDQNKNTLGLTDLHGGNFGWDGKELKVLDVGPDSAYNE